MPARRAARRAGYSYRAPGAYFVTVCARERRTPFGRVEGDEIVLSPAGRLVVMCWHALPAHFPHVAVNAFVVMPDHVHGILIIEHDPDPVPTPICVGAQHAAPLHGHGAPAASRPHVEPGSLGALVRAFKSASARAVNAVPGTPGAPLWQRGYWDRVLRNDGELDRARQYVAENPLRWALPHGPT